MQMELHLLYSVSRQDLLLRFLAEALILIYYQCRLLLQLFQELVPMSLTQEARQALSNEAKIILPTEPETN